MPFNKFTHQHRSPLLTLLIYSISDIIYQETKTLSNYSPFKYELPNVYIFANYTIVLKEEENMNENIMILIVEDEKGISDIEKKYLEKEGYSVMQAFDGNEAFDLLKKHNFDLILLDLMLPGKRGEELMDYIRLNLSTPVIMITAKVEEEEVIGGLKSGADDYITKPFSPKEMVERVKAILRRIEKYNLPKSDWLEFDNGRMKINFDNYRIKKDQEEIFLTKNEFKILKTLFSNPQKIFTREEIIEIAFGMNYDAYDRAIDTHIKNIRHKIEDNPKSPKYVKTVYGVGYKAGLGDEI